MHHTDLALRRSLKPATALSHRKIYDTLMAYYAEDAALVVKPGMVVRGREYPQSALSPLLTISSTDWW